MVAASGLIVVLPGLVVIQQREGLSPYFRARTELAAYLGLGLPRVMPTLAALWPPVGPADEWPLRVKIQWHPDVAPATRDSIAARLALHTDGNDLYQLTD